MYNSIERNGMYVLFQICVTINSIFTSILNKKDAKKVNDFRQFTNREKGVKQFWYRHTYIHTYMSYTYTNTSHTHYPYIHAYIPFLKPINNKLYISVLFGSA